MSSGPTADAIEDLLLAASHDLRAPLRTLLAYTQLLEQDLGGAVSPEVDTDIGHILCSARRLQTMVEDLLIVARASRCVLEPRDVSLDRCVDDALGEFRAHIGTTGAEIERVALPHVYADPFLVTEVYRNLICNALKFSRRGARPRIRLTVEPRAAGQTPILGVADAGIGIPSEHRARVFRPFERLHGRSEYEGTGIGLAICARAVTRMGGHIWVEESEDGGAHVRFTVGDQQSREVATEPSLEAATAVRAAG